MTNDFASYPHGPQQCGPFCFSPAILPRCSRQMLFERPLKMRLISKPRLERHIRNQLPAPQTLAGKLNPLVDQKRVWRHAEVLFEGADRKKQKKGDAFIYHAVVSVNVASLGFKGV